MEYRNIGLSGIKASVVGLGSWAIGGWNWGGTNEPEAIKAIINVSNVIKTEILKMGGEFVCKELPYVVCK